MHSLGSQVTILPQQNHIEKLWLNYRTNPLSPGKYSVVAVYHPFFQKQTYGASQPVAFEVHPAAPSEAAVRVRQIIEQIKISPEPDRLVPLLGFTGLSAAIPPLIDLAYDKSESVRVAAVQSLGYLDRVMVQDALMKALQQRGPSDRMIFSLVVIYHPNPELIRPMLEHWLDDNNPGKRSEALEGLSWLPFNHDENMLGKFVALLGDSDATVQQRAVVMVYQYDNAVALEALFKATSTAEAGGRSQAASAIGWSASSKESSPQLSTDATDKLITILNRDDESAAETPYYLEQIHSERTMTALRERRKTAPPGSLRREIEEALKMDTKN
ncbi:MAG: hypothetical protein ABI210_08945, partial [Abditibacteriaceae bacterium]